MRCCTGRSLNGYDGLQRCRRGQRRYDGCRPSANPTNDERPQMSMCPTPAEAARWASKLPFLATTRLFVPVAGRKSARGASNSTGGGYYGARMARRRSRANSIWEISDSATPAEDRVCVLASGRTCRAGVHTVIDRVSTAPPQVASLLDLASLSDKTREKCGLSIGQKRVDGHGSQNDSREPVL